MSRSQLTILTNICLIEDLETQQVVMQYRSPEKNRWSGYAFPGGHVENGGGFDRLLQGNGYQGQVHALGYQDLGTDGDYP